MATLAQRIEQLRIERNLSRPALAQELGFPKNAPEKFETGRATPTKEQQERMADFFGVSVFYLKGESNDRTRQDTWLEGNFSDSGEGHVPMKAAAPQKKTAPAAQSTGDGAGLFDAFLQSKQFQSMVRCAIVDVLRSPEGEEIIAKVVRKELLKQK